VLFAVERHVKRGTVAIRYYLLPIPHFFWIRIQLNFPAAVPEKPSPAIMGLVHGDPVDPRLQGTLPPKVADVPKYFKEDFLHYVAGFGLVVQ
jgi:hypothetical protein